MSISIKNFETKQFPTWCPGCGNYGIWTALKNSLVEQGYKPHEVAVVFGIGCSGNMASFLNVYGFHGLHGRAIPVATAIKLCNHKLKVIAVGGDGDGYGIGLGHLIHAIRRNIDITYIVHNNQIYSLTKGQTSPTSEKGFTSKSTPFGSIEDPLDPIALAIDVGANFVARGFTGNIGHLTRLISAGIQHRGFSLIDVLQPCVTFNHLNTFHWFYERIYELEKSGYKPDNMHDAWLKAKEWPTSDIIDESRVDKIPIGLFYSVNKETYWNQLPQLKDKALVDQLIDNIDISELMKKLS